MYTYGNPRLENFVRTGESEDILVEGPLDFVGGVVHQLRLSSKKERSEKMWCHLLLMSLVLPSKCNLGRTW